MILMTGVICLAILPLMCFMTSFVVYPIQSESHSWIGGASMRIPRFEISATDLNGKIYVIGGVDKNEYLTRIVEVYDPETNQWGTAPPIPEPLDHTGLASYEGKIYLVGGFSENNSVTDTLYIHDPVIGNWHKGAPMPTPRAGLTANFIDGILYAVGGSTSDNKGQLHTNEAY